MNYYLPTHKFKHRVLIRADPKDHTKVITGIPVIHDVSNQIVAFIELKREKSKYCLSLSGIKILSLFVSVLEE